MKLVQTASKCIYILRDNDKTYDVSSTFAHNFINEILLLQLFECNIFFVSKWQPINFTSHFSCFQTITAERKDETTYNYLHKLNKKIK